MGTCGFYGAYRLLYAGPGWSIITDRPTSRQPRMAPPDGTQKVTEGPMLVFSDPTSTLCTAVVAGFAFGLLLLGNRRR